MALYGVARVATQAPKLVQDLQEAFRNLKALKSGLREAEREAFAAVEGKTEELLRGIDEVAREADVIPLERARKPLAAVGQEPLRAAETDGNVVAVRREAGGGVGGAASRGERRTVGTTSRRTAARGRGGTRDESRRGPAPGGGVGGDRGPHGKTRAGSRGGAKPTGGGAPARIGRPLPSPLGDFDSEEARVVQAKALVHLRPEQSYDAVLAKLRERSRAFAPERDWDADLAPFLERTLKRLYVNELNHLRIAEYAACGRRPPRSGSPPPPRHRPRWPTREDLRRRGAWVTNGFDTLQLTAAEIGLLKAAR